MLEHITHTANSIYARAVSPSQEGLLRTEQQHNITEKPQTAVKNEQAEQIRQDHKVQDRREERRELARYRANNEHPTNSSKHAQSQASQLADKLLESVRQSRQERVKVERFKAASESVSQQSRLNRTYQPTSPVEHPRFVDEIA